MTPGLLSILVPLYNEEEFVAAILARVLAADLPGGLRREIIVVDDGSTDGSVEVVQALAREHSAIRLLRHDRNKGKGAAIRTALDAADGEYALIQDADLEYNPAEYGKLLRPLIDGRADVVFGSRFLVSGERRVLYFWHALANWLLTSACNIVADLNLTDMETCYKAFRTQLAKSIPLRSNRFGMEPEITIKFSKREARIYEVPVSYHGRTYAEGKKIGFRDAIAALAVILRYGFTNDIYKDTGPEILESFNAAKRFNRWMADTIRPYVGSSVIEIGAGIGNLTREIIARRRKYVATDIDDEHLARLAARFQHRPAFTAQRGDLGRPSDFESLSESADTVVCLNVLEHVEDDLLGLRNVRSVLTSGGRAIILVPQGQWAFGKIDVALGHHRRYSEPQLRARLEECGFTLERMIHFNRVSLPGWYLNGSLLGRGTVSAFQLRLFDRFVWLWKRIDPWLPWGPTSLIAIARKPSP
ncbi:MAG: glycosyltransferase [Candidatus Solibacter usitatus]|nr:glycosyltransferase [Candidatus Solibacter usitatus]